MLTGLLFRSEMEGYAMTPLLDSLGYRRCLGRWGFISIPDLNKRHSATHVLSGHFLLA